MAKVAVLEFGQNPEDSPIHFISKSLAESFKSYYHNGRKAVKEIRKGLLAIQADITFGKLKALLRHNGPRLIPKILPPRRPDWHFTAYPIRDQRTVSSLNRFISFAVSSLGDSPNPSAS